MNQDRGPWALAGPCEDSLRQGVLGVEKEGVVLYSVNIAAVCVGFVSFPHALGLPSARKPSVNKLSNSCS